MSEIQSENKLLTKLLEDAADERPGALEAFFEALLRAEVFVGLSQQPSEDLAQVLSKEKKKDSSLEICGYHFISFETLG